MAVAAAVICIIDLILRDASFAAMLLRMRSAASETLLAH
jgi:hypothetical protein